MEEKIEEIIKTLDQELIETGKNYLTLAQANKSLNINDIFTLKEIEEKTFKKLLEQGKIPNAIQTDTKPRQWRIFPSNDSVKNKIKKTRSTKKSAQSNNNFELRNTFDVKGGCASSSGTSAIGIVIGIILCFTGIGAIIGVPLIIAAIILPFLNIGNSMIQGFCPYCGYDVFAFKRDPGVTCKSCKQRILIRDGNFYKLN